MNMNDMNLIMSVITAKQQKQQHNNNNNNVTVTKSNKT